MKKLLLASCTALCSVFSQAAGRPQLPTEESFVKDGMVFAFDYSMWDDNEIILQLIELDESLTSEVAEPIDLVIPGEVEYDGVAYRVEHVVGISHNDRLRSVVFSSGVRDISGCFSYCHNLEMVDFGDTVEHLSNSFYEVPKLKSISFPESLKSISGYCFSYCDGLTSLEFNYPISISSYSFSGFLNIESISFNDDVKIGDGCFSGMGRIRSLALPNNLSSVNYGSFRLYPDLEELYLPEIEGLEINSNAFTSLPNLKAVYCPNVVPPTVVDTSNSIIDYNALFADADGDSYPMYKSKCRLVVPVGSAEA